MHQHRIDQSVTGAILVGARPYHCNRVCFKDILHCANLSQVFPELSLYALLKIFFVCSVFSNSSTNSTYLGTMNFGSAPWHHEINSFWVRATPSFGAMTIFMSSPPNSLF